jgi:hypothetical protein
MAKLQLGAGFDAQGLDEQEYDDSFEPYTGPLPPNNTILKFRLLRAWSTTSSAGNFMIKVMFAAEESGEYDGLKIIDQIPFTETAAWKYKPWMAAMGLTAKLIKAKTIVADDNDEKWGGPQIKSVGDWTPGSDEAVCFIRTAEGTDLDDNPRTEAGKYIPLNDDAAPEDYRPPAQGKGTPQKPRQSKPAQAEEGADDDSLFGDDPPPF